MPDLSELLNNTAPGPMEKPEATTSSNMAGTTFADSGTASHPCLQTIHEPTFTRPETQVPQAEESEEDDDDDDLKKKTALTLAPKSVLDNLDAEPRCMFVKDCRTGSQLRKAISHIFGRNKICTRQIPDNIWVHFCRKHYQRCRYRNVQEYAKLQCQLVVKQIQRVQAWSDRNEARNALGVVSGWTLSVRKREQRRMQTKNDGYDSAVLGQKRPYPGFDGLGMDSEADHRYKDPHAVPNWLLEKCDRSYTTDQTIEIFRQIEQELVEDRLRQIPDVEVLPSITHDPNAEIQYKRYEKRKMVEAALMQSQSHKRVQSTGSHWYGLGSGSGQSYTGYSGPDFWWRSQSLQGTGYHGETKHQRVGDYESSFQPQTHMTDIPPRSESRTVPSIWRSGPAAGSYLPAPVAQRPGTQPAAQQLESSNTTTGFGDTHRPAHHRSQSDVSGFRQLPPVGSAESAASRFTSVNIPSLSTPNYSQRSSSSYYQQDPPRQGSSYTAAQHGQEHIFGTGVSGQKYTGDTYNTGTSRQSSSYNDISPRQQHPPLTPGPSSYYHQPGTSALPMTGRQGHSRHQSTPTISHTSQQMYGSGSSFHSTVVPEGYPPDNQGYGQRSQQNFASGQSKEDLNE
ncbi:hypothetical protein BR93DRAFT_932979 [Coniochaeta sp. PMI_546]|nr:hypothetical protein BR93DRAFT_932979 [Coniochaeta sp. PMI_546]